MAPAIPTNPLLSINPSTLTLFLFIPKDDTTCSLSPTAISKKPLLVFKKVSIIILQITTMIIIIKIG